ncbi:alpha/beta hydrolase [Mycolicibacterium aichiense]|uniref:alpha/beta hydrolase n=1 Tax=Mycolicibacterium aichiense TaxID=1799 RepID=UPI003D66B850
MIARTFSTPRHTTHYLDSGPADGPLMIFLHGWPSIGLIWRAQMEAFSADGWHCVAPDMRGYGGTSAIWVGHDWGSIVAGALTAHEPTRSRGVVLTSWAYFPDANSLATLVPLVDREIYPADEYPDGQWDYYRYYTTHFDSAVADLDADRAATLASVYRRGTSDAVGKVSPTAVVTRNGGRFESAHRAPPTAADPALWPPADFAMLVQAFEARGWYTNDGANIAYARRAPAEGRIAPPVLFVNGEWDPICSITGNRQGEPMYASCARLAVARLAGGHWLPVECKGELVEAIRSWLRSNNL